MPYLKYYYCIPRTLVYLASIQSLLRYNGLLHFHTCERALECIHTVHRCIESVDTFVPSKLMSTPYSYAWCNRDIHRLSRRKKRADRKARATKKQADWNRYKKIQKETQQACRSTHDDYINIMVSEPGSNFKKIFAYITDMKCDSPGVAPLKKMTSAIRNLQTRARLFKTNDVVS